MKIGWFNNTKSIRLDGTVGYNPIELVLLPPEKLSKIETYGTYKHCPAFSTYVDQTYVIRSFFDLELSFNNDEIQVTHSSIEPNLLLERFLLTDNIFPPIVHMNLFCGFVSDESCMIEITGNHFSQDRLNNNIRVVPGTFDIYNWQRSLDFAFEWIDLSKPVVIKRGQPLIFIRFKTKNINEKFQIEKIEMDDYLMECIARCQQTKDLLPNKSWSLMNLNGLLRKRKKFIK